MLLKVLEQRLLDYGDEFVARTLPAKERHGVVYTRPWVVNLILDLVGYMDDLPLNELTIVEPSAGEGSFLIQIVERLVASCKRRNIHLAECCRSIVAYELDECSAQKARTLIQQMLAEHGVKVQDAELLADSWIRIGDYLLDTDNLNGRADFVVGNPPYIRLEELEGGGALYRAAYQTMVGRADIYIAFFEAALRHLRPDGVCGFICADRWMFNQYGAELRRLITSRFSVETVIQMHHANAFESEVDAYPAVTVIRNAKQGPVNVAFVGPNDDQMGISVSQTARINTWFKNSDPWPLLTPGKLALLRRLEKTFPTVEETGAVVGIGVATGADKVFITKDQNLVEAERLLPLAMAADVKGTSVKWSGHYLVNPWNGAGLVELDQYPEMKAYLESHRVRLQDRHVGRKSEATWYRTIDRVNNALTATPKLYFPDFKGRIAPVLDLGETYPHHNLYFIVPGPWDAKVLGGLLISDVAQFFIESYGIRMRGGFLRFQAQYLRRLRVPNPNEVRESLAEDLRQAFDSHDVALANRACSSLYNLSAEEMVLLRNG